MRRPRRLSRLVSVTVTRWIGAGLLLAAAGCSASRRAVRPTAISGLTMTTTSGAGTFTGCTESQATLAESSSGLSLCYTVGISGAGQHNATAQPVDVDTRRSSSSTADHPE